MTYSIDSSDRFEYLLGKAIDGTITDEENNDLYDCLENPDVTTRFCYLEKAVELGYKYSYCPLGRAFLLGEGCEKSFEKARYWLEKSIENGMGGATLLGDCYRLGKEVAMNYETAWKYYSMVDCCDADADDECTLDNITIGNVTLGKSSFYLDRSLPVEWWEKEKKKISGDADDFAEMSFLYEKGSERWLFWIQKAADAENIFAMGEMLERLPTQEERNKYVDKILEIAPDYDDVFHCIGIKILKGDYPLDIKKKAADKIELTEYESKDRDLWMDYHTLRDE